MSAFSEFQLAGYRIKKLNFSLDDSVKRLESSSEYGISIGFDISARKNEKANKYIVKLSFALDKDNEADEIPSPYKIEMEMEGMFAFTSELESDDVSKHLYLSGPSILYGIARGIVQQLTAQTNFPPLILPSVNFHQILTDLHSQKNLPEKKEKKQIPAKAKK